VNAAPPESSPFSLIQGGPLYRLMRALGRGRDSEHAMNWAVFVLVAVAWVPMMILAAVEHYATGHVSAVVADYSVHTRLLLSIPFFFLAERSMHSRTVRCIDRFVLGQWAEGGEAAVSAVTAQAARWRDAALPELVILALGCPQAIPTDPELSTSRYCCANRRNGSIHDQVRIPLGSQFLNDSAGARRSARIPHLITRVSICDKRVLDDHGPLWLTTHAQAPQETVQLIEPVGTVSIVQAPLKSPGRLAQEP
jgi:hypothetical protein